MKMEVYLRIEKAKHDKCYDKIDKYFIENGVKKISTGIYKENDKDFDTIGTQWNLSKTRKAINFDLSENLLKNIFFNSL